MKKFEENFVNFLLKIINKDKLSYERLITQEDITKVLKYFLIDDYTTFYYNNLSSCTVVVKIKKVRLFFDLRFRLLKTYLYNHKPVWTVVTFILD